MYEKEKYVYDKRKYMNTHISIYIYIYIPINLIQFNQFNPFDSIQVAIPPRQLSGHNTALDVVTETAAEERRADVENSFVEESHYAPGVRQRWNCSKHDQNKKH